MQLLNKGFAAFDGMGQRIGLERFLCYTRAWKIQSSICSLPTSALRTKLRVGKAGGCMDAQDG